MAPALRAAAVALGGTLYVSLFWFKPPPGWPGQLGASRRFLLDGVAQTLDITTQWSWVLVGLVLGGLLPALVLWQLGRRQGVSLLGPGQRDGWRLVGLAYAVAFVFLLWLASRQGFRDYYTGMMRRGLGAPALRFMLVLVAEHICIQGLVFRLALGAPESWPTAALRSTATGWRGGLARLLGLGPGPGLLTRLGLDTPVLLALLAQAWVFGWVHVSKDLGELLMSFPGGMALGYLTWRARSVWPCATLHAATGTTVIALAILLFGMKVGP